MKEFSYSWNLGTNKFNFNPKLKQGEGKLKNANEVNCDVNQPLASHKHVINLHEAD